MSIEQDMQQLRQLYQNYKRLRAEADERSKRADEIRRQEREGDSHLPWNSANRWYMEKVNEADEVRRRPRDLVYELGRAAIPSVAQGLQLARLVREVGEDSTTIEQRVENLGQGVDDYRDLCSYYAETSRPADAIRIVRAGLGKFRDVALRQRLENLLEQAGEADELLRLLREDLEASPDDHQIRRRITGSLLSQGRVDEARSFLDAEAAKRPQDGNLREFRESFVVEALLDKNGRSLQKVIGFLQAHPGDPAIAGIRDAFEQTSHWETRVRALHVLTDIQAKGAVPRLLRALKDEDVRLAAAVCLGRAGDARAVPALAQALRAEKDAGTRESTTQALRVLDPQPRSLWEKAAGKRPWAE